MYKNTAKRILSITCILLLSVLCLISCTKENGQSNIQKAKLNSSLQGNIAEIQGKWQSDDDQLSIVEIQNNKFISIYNNEIISTETIEFINNAEERKIDPNGKYFIVKGEFDAMIYYLVSVTNSKLEFSFVGRGNTLRYTKVN